MIGWPQRWSELRPLERFIRVARTATQCLFTKAYPCFKGHDTR